MTRIHFLVLFLLFVGLDAFSKMGAIHWIPPLSFGGYPYGGIAIFPNFLGISFSLNYVVNTGAAWGLFSGHSGLLFSLRILVIAGLIGYLLFFKRGSEHSLPLWSIAAGAFGNALDYLLYGHVIDFFHFVLWGYSFPIFNFADAYITLGVFALLLFKRKEKKQCPS